MRKEKVGIVAVKVIKGDINRALKKYKRKVSDSGHLEDLKYRKTYTKPKTVRRVEKQQAVRQQNRQTILEKIENGDNKAKLLLTTKKKKTNNFNKNEKTTEDLLEKYGLNRK
jgi:ribosomal protein S21